jgi:hypothetical protein
MMYTFKLIAGMHDQGDGRVYKRGDVITSEKELDRIHGANRFLRLADSSVPVLPSAPSQEVDDEFSGMTVAELKKFAEEEEIDLEGATRKEEILSAIRKAVSAL